MGDNNSMLHQLSQSPRGASNIVERRGLLDALDASQALVWFDPEGKIVDVNDNALRMFAYTKDDILKQDYFVLCKATAAQKLSLLNEWRSIANGKISHCEGSFVAKNGQEMWSSVNFAAIKNDDGLTRRIMAIFIDMSKVAWKSSAG